MNRKVKSLLVLHDIKMVDIARKLGVSRVTVSIVITGKGKSRRIQEAIAAMLGRPYKELWPANGHGRKASPAAPSEGGQ